MKRTVIVTVLCLVAIGIAVAQTVNVTPYGNSMWLDASSKTWTQDGGETSDTLTATGTEVYTSAFYIGDGHLLLQFKPKFTSAAADTDSVKIKLYRSPFGNASTLCWKLVDSLMRGGRADTFPNTQWLPSLGGKGYAKSWWRFGFVKMMGVPKLVGIAKGND